jgi:hypothetical protein
MALRVKMAKMEPQVCQVLLVQLARLGHRDQPVSKETMERWDLSVPLVLLVQRVLQELASSFKELCQLPPICPPPALWASLIKLLTQETFGCLHHLAGQTLVNSEVHKARRVHRVCEELQGQLAQLEQPVLRELTALKDRGVLTAIQVQREQTVIQRLFKLGLRRQAIQELTPRLSTVGQFRTPFSTSPSREVPTP